MNLDIAPLKFYPASRFAAVLGVSATAIRERLKNESPAGIRIIGGNETKVFDWEKIVWLKTELEIRAAQRGVTVTELLDMASKPWQPKDRAGKEICRADVHGEEISRAFKIREVLREAIHCQHDLAIATGEIEARGVEAYAREFKQPPGESITPRHFRGLLADARRRAGAAGDFERLEIYLPDHPRLKNEAPAETEPVGEWAQVQAAIDRMDPARRDPAQLAAIWKTALAHGERLTSHGLSERQAGERVRAFLSQQAPWLAASRDGTPNRDALLKQFNHWLKKFQSGGLEALKDGRADNAGERSKIVKQIEELGWFIPAARFFYLLTNRTQDSGSVPEAVRRTISLPNVPVGWNENIRARLQATIALHSTRDARAELPECPEDLREAIRGRERRGKPLVPESVSKRIIISPAIIHQYRNPTNAALDYLSAPGSMLFITDPNTGQRRAPYVGEVIEADDATINFPVCVPWDRPDDPCSSRYGVKVGRFQWLVAIDAASRYVTAWSYVMRPRSSYRAADALVLFRTHCEKHGIPGQFRLEQGVWKSKLVKHAIEGLGCDLRTVYSPHQKPFIEGLFNTLWTKLSVQFPDSDVGRFRGEGEAASDLLTACQRGTRDPRRHFPMLDTALDAFREVIAEKNDTPVKSMIGRWVPTERWEAHTPGKRLQAEHEHLFDPFVREWTVRGMLVGGKVPLFEDFSVPYDFTADWLPEFHGTKVRCHFDPSSANCTARIVLAQNHGSRKAGEILGTAQQINEVAGYVRMVLGWGDDPANAGRLARQRNASALRRESESVIPNGRGLARSEERDGVSRIVKVERDAAPSPVTTRPSRVDSLDRLKENFTAETDSEFEERLARSNEESANRQREIETFERANQHLFS